MRNSGKLNTFLGIFAGVNECSFVQNSCLLWLDLAILWLKVVKNYGVAEICVFLGRILAFLWPQVAKKHGISEIPVFLGRIFGISLASSGKETWHFQNSCQMNFILWVSSLARVVNWKQSGKLHTLLLLERCESCGKVNLIWSIFVNFGVRHPHSV